MGMLNRFSSLADIEAVIDENSDYDSGCGSLDKADKYIRAVRMYLRRVPSIMTHGGRGGEQISFDVRVLKEQLDDALQFRQSQESIENARSNSNYGALDLSLFRG